MLDWEFVELLMKLVASLFIGGLIGAEREFRDKAAGFRTIILICVGATIFTVLSLAIARDNGGNPTRIAAAIVSGVGFLGAGVILRENGRIRGLTTASTVWIAAALGMGIGSGYFAFAFAATAAILAVLWIFPHIEHLIDNMVEGRTYEIVCDLDQNNFDSLENDFVNCGLKIRSHKHIKRDGGMVCVWDASGSPQDHEKMMKLLFDDPQVKEFSF